MRSIRPLAAAVLLCGISLGAAASPQIATNGAAAPLTIGPYAYDDSGNVIAIGTDTFLYDALLRLESGSADGRTKEYTYDAFGNILTIVSDGDQAGARSLGVNPSNNRLDQSSAPHNVFGHYDAAGNMTSYLGIDTFEYDGMGMIKASNVGNVQRAYLYSASDERVATLYVAGAAVASSEWTLRDTGGAVLRRFLRNGSTWRWDEDYVYRDDRLLGAETPAGTHHFHLDHLGSPRLVTGNGGVELARHTYHPFGEEATESNDPERLRFTGHERDDVNLDAMHARYYMPYGGRFLSPDPVLGDPSIPQSWNRYAYARNSPLVFTDPTGEFVDLSTLTPAQRKQLIDGLNDFTGNTYDVDPNTNHLVLVSIGQNASATATAYVDGLIGSTSAYNVVATTKPGASWYNARQNRIELEFNAFDGAIYDGVDPRAFNLGSTAIHEWTHQTTGLFDTPDGQWLTPAPPDYSWTGPVVDAVNVMRRERGLPTRAAYHTEPVRPAGFRGILGIGEPRSAMRFLDPQTGRIVRVIRNVP